MPKVSPVQQNFNAGEFAPLAYGRTDIGAYKNGLRTCLRYIPTIQGPIIRCPGTKFAAEVKDSSKATRLIRFEFSTTQAYILEFGDLYMRVYKDDAQVAAASQAITNITKANPAVVTYSGADTYANGDRVAITGVVGMSQVNNREFTVANVNAGANTFELSGVNSTGYDTYTSGGTIAEIFEIVTPYVEADLFQLKVTQSADTLYIAHPGYAPRKLTRASHTSWTLTTITFLDGPYLPINTTTTTLTPSAATGAGVTVTASATTGINGDTGFQTTDVGRFIRVLQTGVWGYAVITGWTSTTVVTVTIINTWTSTAAKLSWRLGVWSATTGYPAAVGFYEDRLFFGGPTSYPQRLDGSKSSDYENFAPTDTAGTVANDNAVSYSLTAKSVNAIRWLDDDEKALVVGTVGGIWTVRPSSLSEGLSPTNVSAKRASSTGTANVSPVRAGGTLLFVQRALRKVLGFLYSAQVDKFQAVDTTRLAPHITKSGVKELAYQEEPYNVAWAVRTDGVLIAVTFNDVDAVLGWHRHVLGGSFSTGAAVVESVACIPSPDSSYDEVWLIVKRTINGATRRFVEYMMPPFGDDADQEDAYFVDAGLTYDGAPVAALGSLYPWEGQTLSVLVDGAAHPDVTVTNGKVTLNDSYSVIHIGFGYNSDGALLRLDAGAADGTAIGKLQRFSSVVFQFYRSIGLKVGKDLDTLDTISFRNASDPTDSPVPLFTGNKRVELNGDYDTDSYIAWRQDQPLPSTILAIAPQLKTEDRN